MSQIGQRGHMLLLALSSQHTLHIYRIWLYIASIYVYWEGLEPDSQWEWLIYGYYDFQFQFAKMFLEHIGYI